MPKLLSSINRNPNGIPSSNTNQWPLYNFPKREHIILDVFNVSTGTAHRADYCAFWENYIPVLLEEFGKRYLSFVENSSSNLYLERNVLHGPPSSLTILSEKSLCSLKCPSLLIIFILFLLIIEMK